MEARKTRWQLHNMHYNVGFLVHQVILECCDEVIGEINPFLCSFFLLRQRKVT